MEEVLAVSSSREAARSLITMPFEFQKELGRERFKEGS
jgi:hypothetical protein